MGGAKLNGRRTAFTPTAPCGRAMTNEYGETLDRNGYAPSIVQDIEGCYYCTTRCGKLDRHEIYHGAYRKKSKALGLWVLLCHDCHMTLHHKDAALDALLKRQGQRVAMRHYGWSEDEFRARFGKNYI